MVVSYMSDSLLQLVEAAICLFDGSTSVRISFDDEPGEHRCIVNRTGSDIQIRILWFEEFQARLPDDRGHEVFGCASTASQFVAEVFSCCKRLLEEHGEVGYKERWVMHEFPTDRFEHLSRLLYPPRTYTKV